jgi:hypothetical protein
VASAPQQGTVEDDAQRVREHKEKVRGDTIAAAAESRSLARRLRSTGLSVADTAAVLGVSKRSCVTAIGTGPRQSPTISASGMIR